MTVQDRVQTAHTTLVMIVASVTALLHNCDGIDTLQPLMSRLDVLEAMRAAAGKAHQDLYWVLANAPEAALSADAMTTDERNAFAALAEKCAAQMGGAR